MILSNKMKVLLKELNDLKNKRNEEKTRMLVSCLLEELVGKTVPGVTNELVQNIIEIVNSTINLRFVNYNGSIYLLDNFLISYLFDKQMNLISSYLRIKDGNLEVCNNRRIVSYNINRPYHLSSFENKKSSYFEDLMFYNEAGLEYYRVKKVNSYDDSFVKFSFVTNFQRINSFQVTVNGKASIGSINGMDPFEYEQEPYTIEYSGESLDIDVNNYGHDTIDKSIAKKRSKK